MLFYKGTGLLRHPIYALRTYPQHNKYAVIYIYDIKENLLQHNENAVICMHEYIKFIPFS